YLIIEGFPLFEQIDPTYAAILTGAISTALAFATSGIFKNLISGIVMMFIGPFDVGDIVKIKKNKGIVRQITLSKVILETFDGKLIEISNTEVISSTVINYTIKLRKFKTFEQFMKKIQTPQIKAMAQLGALDNTYLKDLYQQCLKTRNPIVHKYTFRMDFPYDGFSKKITQVQKLCEKYKENFGARPWYDIMGFGSRILVKFSILTLDSDKILEDQPKFAKEIYYIVVSN
ncbi:MAG: mechanosensitive ion channel domain-containing protein, partial [Promethearchaeota archaeon]